MGKSRPLSDAMVRMLRDIRDHGRSTYSLHGMSAMGGATATLWALRKRSLVHPHTEDLTQAGHDALNKLDGIKVTMQAATDDIAAANKGE